MRPSPTVISAVATVIFVGTLGLLLVVAGFGIIRIIEDVGEALGLVPTRWGEANPLILVEIAAAISAPIVVWFSVWFFKKAREAEVRMLHHEAPAKPPAG